MTTHFFNNEKYISDSLQAFINKIREIIYFSTVLFIFPTNIKRGIYFDITHDFI